MIDPLAFYERQVALYVARAEAAWARTTLPEVRADMTRWFIAMDAADDAQEDRRRAEHLLTRARQRAGLVAA